MSGKQRLEAAQPPNGKAHEPRRVWRYRVAASGGCLAEQCPPGSFLLEWEDRGEEYDWNVYNFAKGKSSGFASGFRVGTGWVVGDQFRADPQRCMACGKRRKVAGWWHAEADDPTLDPVCGQCGGHALTPATLSPPKSFVSDSGRHANPGDTT